MTGFIASNLFDSVSFLVFATSLYCRRFMFAVSGYVKNRRRTGISLESDNQCCSAQVRRFCSATEMAGHDLAGQIQPSYKI